MRTAKRGRNRLAKNMDRRAMPSLHPKNIDRDNWGTISSRGVSDKANPHNMSRAAPAGYRWEFGALVPRKLPRLRK